MTSNKAGFTVEEWCDAVTISRSAFYMLADNLRPAQVKVGHRRIIVESPDAYLRRLAGLQDHIAPKEAA